MTAIRVLLSSLATLLCCVSIGWANPVPTDRLDTLLDDAMPEGAIWVRCRFDGPPAPARILDKVNDETNNSEDEIHVARRADGRIEFSSKIDGQGARLVSATVPLAGELVQVAIAWGPSGRRLFIDGVEEDWETYPVSWGAGSVGDFTMANGGGVTCDQLEVFDSAAAPAPPEDRASVRMLKCLPPAKCRQGDKVEIKLAFSTAKPSPRQARLELWLVKDDHTVSRAALSFSTKDWRPGEVHWLDPVKFDLFDCPEGKHLLKLKSRHSEILGVTKDGAVGHITVKGHR